MPAEKRYELSLAVMACLFMLAGGFSVYHRVNTANWANLGTLFDVLKVWVGIGLLRRNVIAHGCAQIFIFIDLGRCALTGLVLLAATKLSPGPGLDSLLLVPASISKNVVLTFLAANVCVDFWMFYILIKCDFWR